MDDENDQLMPQKQSLFPVNADDIVDNALQNLDETQAREVTKKAADEVVKLAIEKRKAEYRSARAQDEMRDLIQNANLLDEKVGDYKIKAWRECGLLYPSIVTGIVMCLSPRVSVRWPGCPQAGES